MSSPTEQAAPLVQALERPYQHGFVTDIESDALPPGLDEDTVRAISLRKPWNPRPGDDCRWMPSTSRPCATTQHPSPSKMGPRVWPK